MSIDAAFPRRAAAAAVALAAAALLGACATHPTAPGADAPAMQQALQKHLPGTELAPARTTREGLHPRSAELLRSPLTLEAAVQVALLEHRGLQATRLEADLVAAQLAQSRTLPNPGISFARTREGDEVERELSLHFNVARWLLLPLTASLEEQRLAEARGQVLLALLSHAADTRKAWVQAVAAQQGLAYARQVMQAADASAELARRMEQVGNFNTLARAREQRFYAEAALGVLRAEQLQRATRERLVRLLGLWGTAVDFKLPERLPGLPESAREEPEIERLALQQRLDVAGERLRVEQTARQLGLSRQTRFINVFELGLKRASTNEGHHKRGWEVSFELPLFDWGTARVAQAEVVYTQALHRAADVAINARSEVREAYFAYRTAWDVAQHHRRELVPLAQAISQENLLRYNGMLIGVFELLADARSQIATVNAAIEAERDFWLAQADLEMALLGKPTLAAATAAMAAAPHAAAAEAGGKAPH